jgi:hypothetical protein
VGSANQDSKLGSSNARLSIAYSCPNLGDALYNPYVAMGIEKTPLLEDEDDWTWKDYAMIGFGLDDDK